MLIDFACRQQMSVDFGDFAGQMYPIRLHDQLLAEVCCFSFVHIPTTSRIAIASSATQPFERHDVPAFANAARYRAIELGVDSSKIAPRHLSVCKIDQ